MPQTDGFRALDRQECLRLLAKVPVGRVVYTRQALPAVLPINFSLDTDTSVLLCTSPASDLVHAVHNVVVAFGAGMGDTVPGRGKHHQDEQGRSGRGVASAAGLGG